MRGIKSLGEYGFAKLRGDEEEQKRAIRDINTQRKYSSFGKEVSPVRSMHEAIGTGIELGSYAVGGGGAKTGLRTAGILSKVKEGARYGALGGGLMGGGEELQREDPEEITPGSMLRKAAEFTAYGGVFGGALGGAIGGVSKQLAKRKELQKVILKEIESIKKGQPATRIAEKEIGRGMKWTSKGRIEVEKLVKDKEAKEVIKQGIDKENVALMKVSSDIDKNKYLKMILPYQGLCEDWRHLW